MIDEAIMRPGRLEVQIEISLPDEAGRNQILDIHTNQMKKHGRITQECVERLPEIANLAMNYTGAELEGLVSGNVVVLVSLAVSLLDSAYNLCSGSTWKAFLFTAAL